jgi:hypothetical protein
LASRFIVAVASAVRCRISSGLSFVLQPVRLVMLAKTLTKIKASAAGCIEGREERCMGF